MNLAQLMTAPVITARPETPLPALLELMARQGISAVVLTDDSGRPVGLVTERDITRSAAQDRLRSELTGSALMTGSPLLTAPPDMDYREAFQLMVVSRARHLVVVDQAGQALGMVTESNFLHSLGLEYFVDLSTVNELVSRDLLTLSPQDSVHAALELMHRHCVSCVPAAAAGRPVGILTERDVIRLSLQRLDFYHTRLEAVMSQPVCAVSEQTSLPDVVNILRLQNIRRLVIVDEQGLLVGILTETDLLKGLQSKYSRLLREIIHEQERQLRETRKALSDQAVLRSLLESAPDTGIAATDMSLRILYFNPAAGRIYGYSPEEVIGRTVHEFHVLHQIPPERLDNAARIVREKGFYQYSIQRQKQGRTKHFDMRVSAIRNQGSEMIGYMLIGQDVTRRKEAELAMQRSEERLRRSQEFAHAGSWDWQLESDVLHWSERLPTLFGLPPGSGKGSRSKLLRSVHPDDRERVEEAARDCLERRAAYDIEYRTVWPDGSVHWLHEQGDVVRDEYGEPLNMLGLAQDITRRKEAELELQAQHRFLDSVIETIPLMIFIKDAKELRYVRLNQAGERLTGRPAADFLGRTDADLHPPAEAEVRVTADRRLLASGRTLDISEEEISAAQGRRLLLRTCKAPILDEEGRPAWLLGISEDITEQRAAERNLAEARIQAEKANQAKSDFLANMSHEIRTPMNGIIGLTELALRTELDTQQIDYLEKVNQSAQSLLGLLNDILDLSKIEAHRLELESIPFDLHELLGQISSLMAIHSQQKGIPLRVQIDPDVPRYLLGDPLRIKQILLNLVGNAFKFTKEGEIAIEVRPGLHAQPGCSPVAFTVRDTGIGISREQQGELFKPFVQSDSSTTRLYGGTGLGLAITRQLVEMMDGGIELISAPGEGSSFIFTLPLPLSDQAELAAYREQAEQGGPDPAVLDSIRGARILLVEDNKINQQVAVELLSQECFIVDLAENGEEALALLQPGKYDLVLMDLQMPVMDGYQAVAAIRRQSLYDSLPVLAMSANAMRHDREQCRAAGMNDHIAKPVDRRQLLAALYRWIRPGRRQLPRRPREEAPAVRLPRLCGINSRAALERLGGNQRVYLNILRSFAKDHGETAREIRRLLAANARKEAELLAHSLKGLAGAVGAETLQETARLLETAIRDSLPPEPLLGVAEKQLNQVVMTLLRNLPPPEEQTGKPASAAQIQAALRLLEQRLRDYDAGSAETLHELLRLTAQEPELRQRLAALQVPVEQFDFEAALAVFPEFKPGGLC